jgi:hypothetical protein
MRRRKIPRPRLLLTSALVTTLALGSGCGPKSRDLQPGLYRAVVELPGGEVPFGLEVVSEKSGVALYLVNGRERLPVPSAKAAPGELTAQLPGTGNRLEARISGDELEGEVTLAGPGSRTTVLDFSAVRGQRWRFVEEPRTDNADFSGRWALTFTDDAGRKVPGVAEFKQSFHTVAGSVRTAGWTQQSLGGDASDEQLELSLFDGQQAVLYRGQLNQRGDLVGECWGTATGHLRFSATLNPDATL